MFSTDDSIVAIATPPGRGGIGVVRISGSAAQDIAARVLDRPLPLKPRHATLTRIAARAFSASATVGSQSDPTSSAGWAIRFRGSPPASEGGTARKADREGPPRIEFIDEVVATYFPAPHSYTGEHVVEISAHGNPVVLQTVVENAIAAGARLAEPGEFTLRAFLNGKRDLIQAEAVADLIAAATPLQARVAFDQLEGTLTGRIAAIDGDLFDVIARLEASLDFPDEGYHFIEPAEAARRIACVLGRVDDLLAGARAGRLIRDGATVVVIGRPNVGKSSLFNALAGADRAIVTPIAGTTRDLVSERVEIDGLAVTLVDTAGWRETSDIVEHAGVARSEQARGVADLLVLVLDRSEPIRPEDEALLAATADRPRIVVANKSDLPPSRLAEAAEQRRRPVPTTGNLAFEADVGAGFSRLGGIDVSAKTGAGFDDLRRAIVRELTGRESLRDIAAITNARHIALLEHARASLAAALEAAAVANTPEEFVLADLQAARVRLDEVVGTRTSDDVLRHIFERFCIGK